MSSFVGARDRQKKIQFMKGSSRWLQTLKTLKNSPSRLKTLQDAGWHEIAHEAHAAQNILSIVQPTLTNHKITFFMQNKGVEWSKNAEKRSKRQKKGCLFVSSPFSSFPICSLSLTTQTIMPKEPKCKSNRCSLPLKERTTDHTYQYHNITPIVHKSCWTGETLKVTRTKEGKFFCVHPDCKSSTIIRKNWVQHHSVCKKFDAEMKGIKIETTLSSAYSNVPHRASSLVSHRDSSVVSHRTIVKEGSSVPMYVQPGQEAGERSALKCNQSVFELKIHIQNANTPFCQGVHWIEIRQPSVKRP